MSNRVYKCIKDFKIIRETAELKIQSKSEVRMVHDNEEVLIAVKNSLWIPVNVENENKNIVINLTNGIYEIGLTREQLDEHFTKTMTYVVATLDEEAELKSIVNQCLYVFPKSFVNTRAEFIFEPKHNIYFGLYDVKTALDFKCKMLAFLSGPIAEGLNHHWWPKILIGVNRILGTEFVKGDMEKIYNRLGNDTNRPLAIQFIESGYDLNLLKRESK